MMALGWPPPGCQICSKGLPVTHIKSFPRMAQIHILSLVILGHHENKLNKTAHQYAADVQAFTKGVGVSYASKPHPSQKKMIVILVSPRSTLSGCKMNTQVRVYETFHSGQVFIWIVLSFLRKSKNVPLITNYSLSSVSVVKG